MSTYTRRRNVASSHFGAGVRLSFAHASRSPASIVEAVSTGDVFSFGGVGCAVTAAEDAGAGEFEWAHAATAAERVLSTKKVDVLDIDKGVRLPMPNRCSSLGNFS
jgi:hypothetical protein